MHAHKVRIAVESLLGTLASPAGVAALPAAGALEVASATQQTWLVWQPDLCKQVLQSARFAEFQYSQIMKQVLQVCKADSGGLVRFFRNSPLEQNAAEGEKHHLALRARFRKIYDELLPQAPTACAPPAPGTTTRAYADAYLDRFVGAMFALRPGGHAAYEAVRDVAGNDLFTLLFNPSALIRISRALDRFYAHLDAQLSADDEAAELAEALLTLVLMGRDPLNAVMVAWLNARCAGRDADAVTFRSVSPVVFISRVCEADAELGGVRFRRGQHVVLLLHLANQAPDVPAHGVAFGYGRHFCLGFQFAGTVFGRFKESFDGRWLDRLAPSEHKTVNAFVSYGD